MTSNQSVVESFVSPRRLAQLASRAVLSSVSVACAAAPQSPAASANPATAIQAAQTAVATGLAHPWDMAFVTSSKALVTEKDGQLRLVDLETGTISLVSGFPDNLDNVRRGDSRDNSGMFGIELDPEFATNGLIYIAYSAGDERGTALRVIRGTWNGGDRLEKVEEVFKVQPLSTDRFHYGGGLVFGRDGKLYITAGERLYNEIDQPELPVAQDPSDMRGKIYRINADGTVPTDNPSFGGNAVPGLFALGIRASQGITMQPDSGLIWFSEHGSQQGDEINVLRGGANYGWPIKTTGSYRNKEYAPPSLQRELTAPVHSWNETVAPTGLAFYSGNQFPAWKGDLFVAGLSRGSLWRLEIDGEKVVAAEKLFAESPVRLRKVRQSPDGVLYLLTDEANGRIIRIDPRSGGG